MMMPIVSMNKMAMNESVAATCCYREQASPTNVYWEVLNGGWIGSGYVQELNWEDDSYKGWAVLGFDVNGATGANPLPGISKVTNTSGVSEYWVVDAAGNNVQTVDAFLAASTTFSRGKTCSHSDALCNYKYEDIIHASNQHFGSTGKHDTASDWTKPHTAKQYNS